MCWCSFVFGRFNRPTAPSSWPCTTPWHVPWTPSPLRSANRSQSPLPIPSTTTPKKPKKGQVPPRIAPGSRRRGTSISWETRTQVVLKAKIRHPNLQEWIGEEDSGGRVFALETSFRAWKKRKILTLLHLNPPRALTRRRPHPPSHRSSRRSRTQEPSSPPQSTGISYHQSSPSTEETERCRRSAQRIHSRSEPRTTGRESEIPRPLAHPPSLPQRAQT